MTRPLVVKYAHDTLEDALTSIGMQGRIAYETLLRTGHQLRTENPDDWTGILGINVRETSKALGVSSGMLLKELERLSDTAVIFPYRDMLVHVRLATLVSWVQDKNGTIIHLHMALPDIEGEGI